MPESSILSKGTAEMPQRSGGEVPAQRGGLKVTLTDARKAGGRAYEEKGLGGLHVWLVLLLGVGVLLRGMVVLLRMMAGAEPGVANPGEGSLNYRAFITVIGAVVPWAEAVLVVQAGIWMAASWAVYMGVWSVCRSRGAAVAAAGVVAVWPAGVVATSQWSPDAAGAMLVLSGAAMLLWTTRHRSRSQGWIWAASMAVVVAATAASGSPTGGLWEGAMKLPGHVLAGSGEVVMQQGAGPLLSAVGLTPGEVDWDRRLGRGDWRLEPGEDVAVLWIGLGWLMCNAGLLVVGCVGVARLALGRRWRWLAMWGSAWVAAVLAGRGVVIGPVSIPEVRGWSLVAWAVVAVAVGACGVEIPVRQPRPVKAERRRRRRAWEVDEEAASPRAAMTFSPLAGLPPEPSPKSCIAIAPTEY